MPKDNTERIDAALKAAEAADEKTLLQQQKSAMASLMRRKRHAQMPGKRNMLVVASHPSATAIISMHSCHARRFSASPGVKIGPPVNVPKLAGLTPSHFCYDQGICQPPEGMWEAVRPCLVAAC